MGYLLDVAIIGGGPAGLTAAIYALRGGLRVAVFERLFLGGQSINTPLIENFPGFPEGISGVELAARLEEQVKKLGAAIISEPVLRLTLNQERKEIESSGARYAAPAVILCMGAESRKLGLAREDALLGAGVSYCATCDGAFFRRQEVAVIGGGDTALTDAIYLSNMASKVYLIHRRDAFRAAKILQESVRGNPKIVCVMNSDVLALMGEQKLTGLLIRHQDGGEARLAVRGVFVAIGARPRTELVAGQVTLDDGQIVVDDAMRTSLPGVFAAGDIRRTPLRQLVTAAADGAVAGSMAVEYINTAKAAYA